MAVEIINEFIEWAKRNKWNITVGDEDIGKLPKKIIKKYNIPEGYKKFLENVKTCTNAKESIWFLCIDDYLEEEEDGFRWNEFEMLSIEADEGDRELIRGIKDYWKKHLPIIYNINDEYKYYAIEMEKGKVVYGKGPEFEESEVIANNFEELLEKIIRKEIEL
jgi:predicted phosphohydrolase